MEHVKPEGGMYFRAADAMQTLPVKIKRLTETAKLPTYAHPGDAGCDLYADEGAFIGPNETKLVKCGFAIAVPRGFEAQVRSRSGLALKYRVHVLNSPGTIDSGYRGEVGVVLHNTDSFFEFVVHPGDRIAQLVIAPVIEAAFNEVEELDETDRGQNGYGSSGIN